MLARHDEPPPRRRLNRADRRELILKEAKRFFAQHGFDANTRDLARVLGVTQPLIYRYFPSKEALVQSVVAAMFEAQGRHDWIAVLTDRGRPVRDRLLDFFRAYADRTYDHDWIRLYMFAGLAGGEFNRRYIADVTQPLLARIAVEVRAELAPDRAGQTPQAIEIDFLWVLHGGLYYQAIRRHIYLQPLAEAELEAVLQLTVDALLAGLRKLIDAD